MERPEGFHHHPGGPGGWNPRTNDIDLDEQRKTIAARPGEGGKETPRAPRGLTNTEAPHRSGRLRHRSSGWGSVSLHQAHI